MIENNFITVPYTRELQKKLSQNFSCGNINIDMFIKSPDSHSSPFPQQKKDCIFINETDLKNWTMICDLSKIAEKSHAKQCF